MLWEQYSPCLASIFFAGQYFICMSVIADAFLISKLLKLCTFDVFLNLIPVWVPPTLHWPPLSLKRCFSVGPLPLPVPSATCPAPWSPGLAHSWWDDTRWTQSPSLPCTSRSPWLPSAAGSCSASPPTAGAPSLSAAPCSVMRTCSAPAALNQTWEEEDREHFSEQFIMGCPYKIMAGCSLSVAHNSPCSYVCIQVLGHHLLCLINLRQGKQHRFAQYLLHINVKLFSLEYNSALYHLACFSL